MGRIFGTDGVRGIANDTLDVEMALAISRATGIIMKRKKEDRPMVIVGRDTRLSGTMLQAAVSAGFTSVGCDVVLLGVVPTPAVAFLVKRLGADGGVMITASHNPYMYNGIKYFGSGGFKLTDEEEEEIEGMVLDGSEPITFAMPSSIGTVTENFSAVDDYAAYISSTVKSLGGLRLAVDCANGSASAVAKKIFSGLGAEVSFINCTPNGFNVNDGCGSLHIDGLGRYVKENGFDLGVAFDGDADRCNAVDENGDLIDGDMMMAILVKRFSDEGKLKNKVFVPTVMSNMGLFKFAEEQGLNCYPTKVGDRYVLESLLKLDGSIGGEQSGHIILRDYMSTGDGELSGLVLAETLALSGKKASELKKVMRVYPQFKTNIDATHEMKERLNDPEVKTYIDLESQRLDGDGRILIRPSGTEPLIRIMAEGQDIDKIKDLVLECAETLKILLN